MAQRMGIVGVEALSIGLPTAPRAPMTSHGAFFLLTNDLDDFPGFSHDTSLHAASNALHPPGASLTTKRSRNHLQLHIHIPCFYF